MNKEEFYDLKIGDKVKSTYNEEVYIVVNVWWSIKGQHEVWAVSEMTNINHRCIHDYDFKDYEVVKEVLEDVD